MKDYGLDKKKEAQGDYQPIIEYVVPAIQIRQVALAQILILESASTF